MNLKRCRFCNQMITTKSAIKLGRMEDWDFPMLLFNCHNNCGTFGMMNRKDSERLEEMTRKRAKEAA